MRLYYCEFLSHSQYNPSRKKKKNKMRNKNKNTFHNCKRKFTTELMNVKLTLEIFFSLLKCPKVESKILIKRFYRRLINKTFLIVSWCYLNAASFIQNFTKYRGLGENFQFDLPYTEQFNAIPWPQLKLCRWKQTWYWFAYQNELSSKK